MKADVVPLAQGSQSHCMTQRLQSTLLSYICNTPSAPLASDKDVTFTQPALPKWRLMWNTKAFRASLQQNPDVIASPEPHSGLAEGPPAAVHLLIAALGGKPGPLHPVGPLATLDPESCPVLLIHSLVMMDLFLSFVEMFLFNISGLFFFTPSAPWRL